MNLLALDGSTAYRRYSTYQVIADLLGMCARFDAFGRTVVWGGFASKMGLAFGPLLGAYTVGDSRYGALIAVSLVLLALAFLCAAIPALLLGSSASPREA